MSSIRLQASPAEAPPASMAGQDAHADASRSGGWARGWRGPLLAALIVLAGALPGLLALPPLDRDESRFAQSTAQMLETGDFVDIRFQDQPRDKKPVGINWLQALSVQLASSVERREIWAYRLPSMAGAMLAAAACAWGAARFFGSSRAFFAGAILGASFLLSTEAFIAKTDAALCGAVTLSMAALARLYGASRGVGVASRRTKALFWCGQGLALLIKGPIGPMIAGLTLLSLWAMDRRAAWMRGLGWGWGLLFAAALFGPWAVAVSVMTDGGFWTGAIGSDLAPKLVGGQEGHGAPPGYYLLLLPLLLFPLTFLLPAALVRAWQGRAEAGVRFALAWVLPSWIAFELMPTKLPHYVLPLYGGLAWLAASALGRPIGRWARLVGAGLSLLAAAAYVWVLADANWRYGTGSALGWTVVCASLVALAGVAGAAAIRKRWTVPALAGAGVLGVAAHTVAAGGLAPLLSPLWTSERAAALVARAGLDPRNGLTPGPVAVAGYAEPSLVFALGTETELGDGEEAAEALADGQPALVERRQTPAFLAGLAKAGIRAQAVGSVSGFDYSDHKSVALTLWRALNPKSEPNP